MLSGGDGAGTSAPPDAEPQATASCADKLPLAKPRIWRLTKAQVASTLRDLFAFVPAAVENFPDDSRISGFANQADALTISPLLAESYFSAGEQLAAAAVASPAAFGIGCALDALGDGTAGTCLHTFVTSLGEKMWRRPLTEAEVASFIGLYTTTATQGAGPKGGVQSVVQAFFLSPSFLHRSELGASAEPGQATPLTDYELASALSYTIWDSAPDAELLGLAKQSQLRDKAVLAAQAKRMLRSAEHAAPAMQHFLQQWMFLENLPRSDKDLSVYPLGTPEVRQDLLDENRLFIQSVLFDPARDGTFKTLLNAPYSFVNARTAPLYGLTGITSTQLVRTELDPNERRGIFSQAAFMWSHGDPNGTRLVSRGAYFAEQVLCEHLPPPPPGAVDQDVRIPPADATGREKFAIHSASPACSTCHHLFDGVGFAMEAYDGIGQFRSSERGKPIDASGTLPLPSDPGGPGVAFKSFVDLMDQLATKPDIYSCFAKQYLSYATGKRLANLDACEQSTISDDFTRSGYTIDSLVESVVASPSFMARQN